jgi:twitching motility protein PilT
MNFDQLLRFGVEQGASDIHLQAGSPPALRIQGQVRGIDAPPLVAEELRAFAEAIAPRSGPKGFEAAVQCGLSFSHTVEGLARFRGQLHSQLGAPGLVLHIIPLAPPSLETLNLPTPVRDIALARRGLILVGGTAGSGKTTTLAAMVDLINNSYYDKIVTVEEPVEYQHANKRGQITHIEVGRDTPSLLEGLRLALRLDPDVILVSELRDSETVQLALRAADMGRQVLSTIPSATALQALERTLAMMPASQLTVAKTQLANAIVAILAQRLATTRDNQRRPVVEILRGGPVFAHAVLEDRLRDLTNYMSYREVGMQRIDQHLLDLYQSGVISGTEALRLATDPETLATELRTARRPTAS